MKKILILMMSCMILGACTHEKEAQELYSKATTMKLNMQYAEAVPIYKEVISKYPRSSVISSATSDLAFCGKRILEQKIEHNTPIILKAVDEFPARKFPANRKGNMPLGKSIVAFNNTLCNTAQEALNKAYGVYEILAARTIVDSACSYRVAKWQIDSTNNKIYTVSKIARGKTLTGENNETLYIYTVNLAQETISPNNLNSCFVLNLKGYESVRQETKEDYSKCSYPIKLEGVLK